MKVSAYGYVMLYYAMLYYSIKVSRHEYFLRPLERRSESGFPRISINRFQNKILRNWMQKSSIQMEKASVYDSLVFFFHFASLLNAATLLCIFILQFYLKIIVK